MQGTSPHRLLAVGMSIVALAGAQATAVPAGLHAPASAALPPAEDPLLLVEQAIAATAVALAEAQEVAGQVGDEVIDHLATAAAALREARDLAATASDRAAEALARAVQELEAAQAALEQAVAEGSEELQRQVAGGQSAVEQTAAGAQAELGARVAEAQAAAAAARKAAASQLRDAAAPACAPLGEALLDGPVVLWTSCNMGAGSGLDADLLDGFQAQHFLDLITAEAVARELADALLRAGLDAETAERIAADVLLHGRVDALQVVFDDALADERDARELADALLRAGLDAETAERIAAEVVLHGRIDAEAAARARGDDALRLDLADEAAARRDAEALLRAAVDAERSDRGAAVDGLRAGVPSLAWDSVLARMGPGSGLDADLLDGLHAADFASAGHDHDGRYYTRPQSDAVFARTAHDHDERYFTELKGDARYLGVDAKAADAGLLDGLDSLQFLRRDQDDSTSGSLGVAGGLRVGGTAAIEGKTRLGGAGFETDNALHVLGRSSVLRLESTNDYAGIRFKNGHNDQGYIDYNRGDFRVHANSGEIPTLVVQGGAPGKVGIGTAAPAVPLHVDSGADIAALRLQRSSVSPGRYDFLLSSAASGEANTLVIRAMDANTGFDLEPRDASGALLPSAFRVANNGNVGIGVAAPTARLDVAGDANAQRLCIAGACRSAWPSGSGAGQWTDVPGGIVYADGGAGVSGRFGVGTGVPPPSIDLQVVSPAGGREDADILLQTGNAGKKWYLTASDSGTFHLSDGLAGATRLAIDPAGRIGIGTTSPGAQLELGYSGRATTIKVGQARFGQSGGLPFVDAFADVTANAVAQDENTWLADNPNRPSWLMRLDAEGGSSSADGVFFNYAPPGGTRSFTQKMKLTGDGDLRVAGSLQVGGGSVLQSIQKGVVGDYVGKTGTSVTFPQAFASPPMVQLTVDESDDNLGATGCRLSAISATGFTFWCFQGTADTNAFRVHWLAIG